jgi:hypothetical protein
MSASDTNANCRNVRAFATVRGIADVRETSPKDGFWTLEGYRPLASGKRLELGGAISGNIKVSFQAARSIG